MLYSRLADRPRARPRVTIKTLADVAAKKSASIVLNPGIPRFKEYRFISERRHTALADP
jgi:hypothetical protein